ncbi:MAG TPA: YcxB family protein [Anaerolineaceae bacterium]
MIIEYLPPGKNNLNKFIDNLKSSPKARFWLLLAMVVLEGFYFFNQVAMNHRSIQLSDIVVAVGILFIFPAYIYLMFAMRLKTQKRTLTIAPEGIFTNYGQQSLMIGWPEFSNITAADELVIISGKSGNEFTIPRTAFSDDRQQTEFIKLVSGYIRDAETR